MTTADERPKPAKDYDANLEVRSQMSKAGKAIDKAIDLYITEQVDSAIPAAFLSVGVIHSKMEYLYDLASGVSETSV